MTLDPLTQDVSLKILWDIKGEVFIEDGFDQLWEGEVPEKVLHSK